MQTVLARKEAKALGMSHYYNGVPCRRFGHLCERWTASGSCIECLRIDYPKTSIYQAEWGKTPKGIESRRRALKKYNAKPEARAKRKAYVKTEAGKASLHKHYLTLRSIIRHTLKRVLKRHAEKWPNDPSRLCFEHLLTLWTEQGGRCALSSIQLTWGSGTVQATSSSIDRIDGNRGYHPDNIRFLCTNINAFRGSGTDAEMLAMAKAIVAYAEHPDRINQEN